MKNKGLTLIETVIAISIFSVASIIITTLFISHTKLYKTQSGTSEAKIERSLFSQMFKSAGNSALSIEANATIGGYSLTSSSSTVIFKVPSINESQEIISNTFDYIAFHKDGDNLYSLTDANLLSQRKDIVKLISDSAENLIFRYNKELPTEANFVNAYFEISENNEAIDSTNIGVALKNK